VNRDALIRFGAIGAGVAVVIAVAVAAFISLQQPPFQAPTSTPNATPCSPQPCADVRGFRLWVTDLKIDPSGLVSMQLTFRNSSNATHADPTEIQLIDSGGHPYNRVTDAPGCTAWSRTEFNNGTQFGPVAECFQPSTTAPPLKLHWEPDFGFFCCETNIQLTS
jgi:hypothetical protein